MLYPSKLLLVTTTRQLSTELAGVVHLHELQDTVVPRFGADGGVLPFSAFRMALIYNSNPVLHPEVALGAGQCIALQIYAQRVKRLVYPNPELTSACLKESAEPKQNLRGGCDNADGRAHMTESTRLQNRQT